MRGSQRKPQVSAKGHLCSVTFLVTLEVGGAASLAF